MAAPSLLSITGDNLAPTGADELTCRFRIAERPYEEAYAPVNATFVSSRLVRCLAPRAGEPGVGSASEFIDVRLSHSSGATGVSLEKRPLLYIDSATPPIVSHIAPTHGPVYDATRVTVRGWNFGPTAHRLLCRFGGAPYTRGGSTADRS